MAINVNEIINSVLQEATIPNTGYDPEKERQQNMLAAKKRADELLKQQQQSGSTSKPEEGLLDKVGGAIKKGLDTAKSKVEEHPVAAGATAAALGAGLGALAMRKKLAKLIKK